jgi:hypothetical protein
VVAVEAVMGRTQKNHESRQVRLHADVNSPYKAMKAVQGMDALEIQLEREKFKESALWYAISTTAPYNYAATTLTERLMILSEEYDEMTAKLIRDRLVRDELLQKIREREKECMKS